MRRPMGERWWKKEKGERTRKKKHEKGGTSNILTKNEVGLGFCHVYVGSTCGNHDHR